MDHSSKTAADKLKPSNQNATWLHGMLHSYSIVRWHIDGLSTPCRFVRLLRSAITPLVGTLVLTNMFTDAHLILQSPDHTRLTKAQGLVSLHRRQGFGSGHDDAAETPCASQYLPLTRFTGASASLGDAPSVNFKSCAPHSALTGRYLGRRSLVHLQGKGSPGPIYDVRKVETGWCDGREARGRCMQLGSLEPRRWLWARPGDVSAIVCFGLG